MDFLFDFDFALLWYYVLNRFFNVICKNLIISITFIYLIRSIYVFNTYYVF
jgi:hypothetical protein